MNYPSVLKGLLYLFIFALCARAEAEPPQISIQGKLQNAAGAPLLGTRAYRVRFFNASTAGAQLGANVTGNVALSSAGRFSIVFTPPPQILNQNIVYYELAIDSAATPDGAIGTPDIFPNRVQVTSVPFARNAGQLGGVAASTYVKTTDLASTTSQTGGSTFWRLGGNTITNPATQFFGSSNDSPFEFRANNLRAARFESTGIFHEMNVVLGHRDNAVTPGASGATIGGGGTDFGQFNIVTDDGGTVAGGFENQAGDGAGSTGDRPYAMVGGGLNNIASGSSSSVVGGTENLADGQEASVGGGRHNAARGLWSVVPGGVDNRAQGQASFAAGQRAVAQNNGTFVWADNTFTTFTSTANNQFLIRAGGGVGINKNNPAAGVLDVAGNIAFSGELMGKAIRAVPAAGQRMISGVVQGNGTIFEGVGFTVSRVGAGIFALTYDTAFADNPMLNVTVLDNSAAASIVPLVPIISSSTGVNAQVRFFNLAGTLTDPKFFHFTVVGP